MYAIVNIAGQQFKVEAGAEIFVNRLAAKKDESVEFNQVLLIDNEGDVKVGVPYVEGAVVKATVLEDDTKAKKVIVFKKIRRKGYQKSNGHRQKLTKIRSSIGWLTIRTIVRARRGKRIRCTTSPTDRAISSRA